MTVGEDGGAHSVVYTGYADENGIWRKWKLVWMRGDFHIWPKKNGAEGEGEEINKAVNVTEAAADVKMPLRQTTAFVGSMEEK